MATFAHILDGCEFYCFHKTAKYFRILFIYYLLFIIKEEYFRVGSISQGRSGDPRHHFLGIIWWFHTRARQRQDNKTNVEPVHSYMMPFTPSPTCLLAPKFISQDYKGRTIGLPLDFLFFEKFIFSKWYRKGLFSPYICPGEKCFFSFGNKNSLLR